MNTTKNNVINESKEVNTNVQFLVDDAEKLKAELVLNHVSMDKGQVKIDSNFVKASNCFWSQCAARFLGQECVVKHTNVLQNYASLSFKIHELEQNNSVKVKGIEDRKKKLDQLKETPLLSCIMPTHMDVRSDTFVGLTFNSLMIMLICDPISIETVNYFDLNNFHPKTYIDGDAEPLDYDSNIPIAIFNKIEQCKMHTPTVNTLLGYGIELVYLANMIEMFVGLDDVAVFDQFTASSADMMAAIENFNIPFNKQQYADALPTSMSDLLESYGFSTNIPLVRSNVGKVKIGNFSGDITSFDLMAIMLLGNVSNVTNGSMVTLGKFTATLDIGGSYTLSCDNAMGLDQLLTTFRFLYALRYARRNMLIKNFNSAISANAEFFEAPMLIEKIADKRNEGIIDG